MSARRPPQARCSLVAKVRLRCALERAEVVARCVQHAAFGRRLRSTEAASSAHVKVVSWHGQGVLA